VGSCRTPTLPTAGAPPPPTSPAQTQKYHCGRAPCTAVGPRPHSAVPNPRSVQTRPARRHASPLTTHPPLPLASRPCVRSTAALGVRPPPPGGGGPPPRPRAHPPAGRGGGGGPGVRKRVRLLCSSSCTRGLRVGWAGEALALERAQVAIPKFIYIYIYIYPTPVLWTRGGKQWGWAGG
jgi:hypothetical protein